jgi:ribonuclease HI
MYFNGSLTKEGRGVGLVFISPLSVCMEYMIRLHFPVSNNVAEYEALLNGLKIALEIGVWRLEVRWDSKLVVNQMTKEANCVNPKRQLTARPSGNSKTSSMGSSLSMR